MSVINFICIVIFLFNYQMSKMYKFVLIDFWDLVSKKQENNKIRFIGQYIQRPKYHSFLTCRCSFSTI